MIYENCKIYGPYKSKDDNRLRINVVSADGKMKTVSYPKYLMEIHLQRYLDESETIDHIDCDPLNNEISNLRVMSRDLHASIDAKRLKTQSFECPMCNRIFSLSGKRLSDAIRNRKKNKAGPFCSRQCTGHYGKAVQIDDIRLEVVHINPLYTTLKKSRSLHEETHEVDIAKTVNA